MRRYNVLAGGRISTTEGQIAPGYYITNISNEVIENRWSDRYNPVRSNK